MLTSIISTSLAFVLHVQHFMLPSNGKLAWKVLVCYIPFSSHCSHKKFPILSEYCVVPVFANRRCEPWVRNLQIIKLERKGILYVAAEASMVLCIIWGITIVGSQWKIKMMLLSRLCPLSEDSCYPTEKAINHFSGNGALFLALPWMISGKKMTLCALYPVL